MASVTGGHPFGSWQCLSYGVAMNDGEMATQRLYAWLAKDDTGAEGIMTVRTNVGLMPMVATDLETAQSWRPIGEAPVPPLHDSKLVVFNRAGDL